MSSSITKFKVALGPLNDIATGFAFTVQIKRFTIPLDLWSPTVHNLG